MIAVGIGFLLGYLLKEWSIGFVFLLVSVFLWFYSCVYKKHFVVGNFFIGFLFALIPMCVGLFETSLLRDFVILDNLGGCGTFIMIYYVIACFAWFTFLNTVIHEVDKDMFTVDGDKANGIRTIPVSMGMKSARQFLTVLTLLALISLLVICCAAFIGEWYVLIYSVVLIAIPYIAYIWIVNCNMNRRLHQFVIKFILLTTLGVSVFLPYIFK